MKMIKIVFFTLLSISTAFGQIQNLGLNEVEDLFAKKRFTAVWQYYHDSLKKDSTNAELNYKMGVCYLHSRSQKEKAVAYLNRASKYNEIEAQKPAIDYKLLADASYVASDFEDAIVNYQKYSKILLSSNNCNIALSDEISRKTEMSKMAKDLKELKEQNFIMMNHKNKNKNLNNSSELNKSMGSSFQNFFQAFVFGKPNNLGKTCHDKDFFEDNIIASNTLIRL